jgi:hypothetical protein
MNQTAELPDTFVEERPELLRQPSSEEIARLTYGLRDTRTCTQAEERNHFAHLLNRGSSLE